MASMWSKLGLDGPTHDMKAIKRAYAAKLKVTRPEDDAVAFMALRDAFAQARDYARYHAGDSLPDIMPPVPDSAPKRKATKPAPKPITIADPETAEADGIPISDFLPENFDPDAQDDAERADDYYDEDLYDGSEAPAVAPGSSDLDKVMEKVEHVMADPWRRNNANAWKSVFDDPLLDGIDTYTDFDYALRNYLLQYFGHFDDDPRKHNRAHKPRLISTFVGTFIFDSLNWHDAVAREPWVQQQIDVLREDFDILNRQREKQHLTPKQETYAKEAGFAPVGVIFFVLWIAFVIFRAIGNS